MKMSEIYYGYEYLYQEGARSNSPGRPHRVRVVGTSRYITTKKGTRQPRGVDVEFRNFDGTDVGRADTVPSDDIVKLWTYYERENKEALDKAEVMRREAETRRQRSVEIVERAKAMGMSSTRAYAHEFTFILSGDDMEKLLNMVNGTPTITDVEFIFNEKTED